MKGSIIAAQIVDELKKQKYYKKKMKKERCKDSNCYECKYKNICEDYSKG